MARGRIPEHTAPTAEPTEADLIWAASLYELRGRYNVTGSTLALQMNFPASTDYVERLVRLFGGRLYLFGSTKRWQLAYDPERTTFLQRILPHLTPPGRERVEKIQELIAVANQIHGVRSTVFEETERQKFEKARQKLEERARRSTADVALPPTTDLFNLPDAFDPDIVEVTIPALLEDDVPITCRAKTEESAARYAEAFVAAGLVVAHKGTLVAVGRPAPEGAPSHA